MRAMHVLLGLALLGGCAKGPNVEPAPDAQMTNGEAFSSDAGVTMRVDPKTWYGLDLEEPDLAQLHVEIVNDSGRPLRLEPEYFSLVASDGQSWNAVDPNRPDMLDLDLKNELFEEGITSDIIEDIEPGDDDDVEGNIYFRGVPDTARSLQFRAQLVDATTGQQFGTITIPLRVAPDEGLLGRR